MAKVLSGRVGQPTRKAGRIARMANTASVTPSAAVLGKIEDSAPEFQERRAAADATQFVQRGGRKPKILGRFCNAQRRRRESIRHLIYSSSLQGVKASQR